MKRSILTIICAVVLGVLTAWSNAFAYSTNYSQVGDVVKFGDGVGTKAGEFTMTSVDGIVYNNTFCVDSVDYLDYTSEFKVKSINAATDGAAYLYYHFVMGDLNGYNYTDNPATVRTNEHAVSADALQLALWQLQGQTGGAKNDFYYMALSADAQAEYAAIRDYVGVLVMEKQEWISERRICTGWVWFGTCVSGEWKTIPGYYQYSPAQDVLGFVKDPTPPVQTPEPASMILLGLGLLGLAGARRRSMKK